MPRVLLLLFLVIWLAWTPTTDGPHDPAPQGALSQPDSPQPAPPLGGSPQSPAPPIPAWDGPIVFIAGYVCLVLALGIWSRRLARRVSVVDLYPQLRRFSMVMTQARLLCVAWFATGLFALDWAEMVHAVVGGLAQSLGTRGDLIAQLILPTLLPGIAPGLLAWVGLWWAQFPADRAMKEQNLVAQLDADLPLHAPPPLGAFLRTQLRLQLGFTLLPVLLILLLRDSMTAGLLLAGVNSAHVPLIDALVTAAGAIALMVFGPALFVRVLRTTPLPDSPLRRRLEAMCGRAKLGCRDILLWHTNGSLGNAAVMGLIPRFRYVLLTDLLLETMTDRQIEAVFAHETGHIVHRHLAWFAALIALFTLAMLGPGQVIDRWLTPLTATHAQWIALGASLGSVAVFWTLFGFISRHFERQADVFAARTVGAEAAGADDAAGEPPRPGAPQVGSGAAPTTWVTPAGARLFNSALHRVAVVNGMSIEARDWLHGSIASRARHIDHIAHDAQRTFAFDRRVNGLKLALLTATLAMAAWAVLAST